jgi:hypothetical protein
MKTQLREPTWYLSFYCLDFRPNCYLDYSLINIIQLNSFLFMFRVNKQGQLQTQHSAHAGNHIVHRHNIKSKTNYVQARGGYISAAK